MKLFYSNKFSRAFVIGLAIILQGMFFFSVLVFFNDYSQIIYTFSMVLSLSVVVYILQKDSHPNYKLAWIIPILIVPVFGGIFYVFFGTNQLSLRERRRMAKIDDVTKQFLLPNHETINHLEHTNWSAYRQTKYIQDFGFYPPAEHSYSEYLPTGEANFMRLKEELRKAKHFIFMEYFIVHEGKMWNEILEILVQKAAEGVDVRFIYDDFGCIFKLPHEYYKTLRSKGIQCQVFNPLIPIISTKYNTRDHRKITVIDNRVGFTGGINLADEYINEYELYGHWKDVGIMIQGDAVWNFTVMFLTMWDYLSDSETDLKDYRLMPTTPLPTEDLGVIQPFSDNPLDDEPVGQNVYLNLINKAERYVYICTPYLVIDDEMSNALTNAAKAGVDVRIITPHRPDKWYVHAVSRSYYLKLLKYGVKIYEYEPGFIHSKTFVVDDIYSIVGTINLDYRSLFLHFECGVWTYKTGIEKAVRDDFLTTQDVCIQITPEHFKNKGLIKTLGSLILKMFAPLM